MQQQLLVGLLRPALQPRAGLFPLGIIPPDLADFPPPPFPKAFSLSFSYLRLFWASQAAVRIPLWHQLEC